MTALRLTQLAEEISPRMITAHKLGDMRFRSLLSAEAWGALPPAVRTRFTKCLGAGMSVTYAGTIVASRKNWFGRALTQMLRLVGAPLPIDDEIGAPAVVSVTQDSDNGGQFWTRIYGRKHGFPQVIHSSKRFSGPTGLEEYLGFGLGIALTLRADAQGLHFLSDHYFFKLGRIRLRLPRLLSPGNLTISHIERTLDEFEFRLSLSHPFLGKVIYQSGYFCERRTDIDLVNVHD